MLKLYVMFVMPPKGEVGTRTQEIGSRIAYEVHELNRTRHREVELSQDFLEDVLMESLSDGQREHFDRRFAQIKAQYFDALVLKGKLRSSFVGEALSVASDCGVTIVYDDLNVRPLAQIIDKLQGKVLPEEEARPAETRPAVAFRPVRT